MRMQNMTSHDISRPLRGRRARFNAFDSAETLLYASGTKRREPRRSANAPVTEAGSPVGSRLRRNSEDIP